jgi:hypothetical protein
MTPRRDDVMAALLGADAWQGFDPTGWEDTADKWDSHHPWFDEAVKELSPMTIVEVGAFLGCSSRHFARLLKRDHINGVVVSVDTWLAESVLWESPEWRPHLRHEHGRPQIYNVWMANALASGLQDWMCPLSMDSANGARYLYSKGISADMVYIDGSHFEGDVYRDLTLYWDLVLRPGGILIADDYQPTPDFAGVVHDLDRFVAERGLVAEVGGTKVRLRKVV